MAKDNGLPSPTDLSISIRGPLLTEGTLPAFFYFALSGEDSLYLDPYNQPAAFLDGSPIRCYSFTLPFHGPGYDNHQAIQLWSQEIKNNPGFLEVFFQKCLKNIDFLIQQGYVDKGKIAVGGLSRGGFVATHLAARDSRIQYVLGYAPMTKLSAMDEVHEMIPDLDLKDLIPQLVNKQVRFYIGNRDLRVSTQACFEFVDQLADASYRHGHRSPPIELMISPSVGFKGHGTLPHLFQDGINWIKCKFNIIN